MIEVSADLKMTYWETAQVMKGSERRMLMGRIVNALGRGGQVWAERELGWCREVIRKGQWELENGPIQDNCAARGRNGQRNACPSCGMISASWWTGKARPTPAFKANGCIRGSRPKK
jgi:hypothetical protein